MSTFNKKSTKTYAARKNPYANAKKFSNSELISIFIAHATKQTASKTAIASWMDFDTKNETQNEKMKENGNRYLQVMVTDLEGKSRPLVRSTAACATKSKCKPGKTEPGKISSKFSFSTRVLIPEIHLIEIADLNERSATALLKKKSDAAALLADPTFTAVDAAKLAPLNDNQSWLLGRIDEIADDVVNTKYPDLPDDQFDSMSAQQSNLIQAEYSQWCVEQTISREYERLINDKAIRLGIKYAWKKDLKISGNVQYDRTPAEDDPDQLALANEDGVIALEEPMIYHGIRVGTSTGELWCRIYDKTVPVKGGKAKLATMKDPESGKQCFLTNNTLETWLRAGSIYIGIEKYQLCISGTGARMHATLSEMHVKRAAKSEAGAQIDDDATDQLELFGGQFDAGGDDDDDDETPTAPKAGKPTVLSGIEAQMAALKAGVTEDD